MSEGAPTGYSFWVHICSSGIPNWLFKGQTHSGLDSAYSISLTLRCRLNLLSSLVRLHYNYLLLLFSFYTVSEGITAKNTLMLFEVQIIVAHHV